MKAAVCVGVLLGLGLAGCSSEKEEEIPISQRLVSWSGDAWRIQAGGCEVLPKETGIGVIETTDSGTGLRVYKDLKGGKLEVRVGVANPPSASAVTLLESFVLDSAFLATGVKDVRSYNVGDVPVRVVTWGGECSGVGVAEDPSSYLPAP